eukprot:GHUV01028007.1.p1 GENE.GHUV01028007.1~~GHUV01028007.1.p1  ORF type:complete len:220 (+),score=54.83 GHUV01028007.1:206-865(+)
MLSQHFEGVSLSARPAAPKEWRESRDVKCPLHRSDQRLQVSESSFTCRFEAPGIMSSCIYDIKASWADNIAKGPCFDGPVPERHFPPPDSWIDFLGHKVASPIGVPAGPLLDSRWTTLACRLGYDIVTYKTIRTQASCGHAPPNVLYLQAQQQLGAADDGVRLQSAGQDVDVSLSHIAITNSFGMPSMTRDFLQQDIPAAQAALGPGQVRPQQQQLLQQ